MKPRYQLLIANGITTIFGLTCWASWAQSWPDNLSYAGGGAWKKRVQIVVEHNASQPLAGVPISLGVRENDGTAALIGEPVSSLRVIGANGVEYLFNIATSRGMPKREGVVSAGDVLTVPIETEGAAEIGTREIEAADTEVATVAKDVAGSSVPPDPIALFVYAGNPLAWLPPEWFGGQLANLDFEDGAAGQPAGWSMVDTDAQHRMVWQEGDARTGRMCARCEVNQGAEPSWVKYMQRGRMVSPGQRYRLTAWTKAQDVKGNAGWFIHINGKRPQLVNRSDTASGTFGWRQMTIEFEVPEGGNELVCGTILRGTGTAWYDNVQLELLGDQAKLTATVGQAESRTLRKIGHDADWMDGTSWRWRAPVLVRNYNKNPLVSALVTMDMQRLRNRLGKILGFQVEPVFRLVDPRRPSVALNFAGDLVDGLHAMVDVPAGTELTLWLYVSADPDDTNGSPRADLADWASSPLNLVQNGAMEDADSAGKPVGWIASEEGNDSNRRFTARLVSGGVAGSRCLELAVPKTLANPGWMGWRQMVAVQPNARYLLSGQIHTKEIASNVKIHGHFKQADGTHTRSPFFGTGQTAAGNQDWTRTSIQVATPPDCAFIEVHLTMNTTGTLRHDNILLTQVAEGVVGEPQTKRSAEKELEVWSVNPLVKVFRQDVAPKNASRSLQVHTFRNAWKACQFAIRAPSSGSFSVRVAPFARATAISTQVYRVEFVPIDFPMGYASSKAPDYHRLLPRGRGSDGWADWWPDPMVPVKQDASIPLKARQTEVIWLDIQVPAQTPPGGYQTKVLVSDGQREVELPLKVTVWNLVMPAERHLPALYDLRGGRGMSPYKTADIATWYRFLARYNVSPSFVVGTPFFTYRDGTVAMDTTRFDELAHILFDECHVSKVYTPNRWFYACGWAYPPKRIFGLEPFTPEYVKAWSDAYRMFVEHLAKKGWRDNFVYYISDEPHKTSDVTITGIARIADMARSIAPDMLVYSSTWRYIDGLADHLTLWGMGPQGSFDPERHKERLAKGDRFWYTTDGQMCTDTPFLAIETLLPWFCFKYGCEAYEFWGVSWWTYNPWERGWHTFIRQSSDGKEYRWVRYPNGDGFLAYPGDHVGHDGPLPSIRLVAAREGVDDYELFLALKAFADKGNSEAKQALDRVCSLVNMPNRGGRYSTDIMPDPEAVVKARIAAGDLLDRLAAAR